MSRERQKQDSGNSTNGEPKHFCLSGWDNPSGWKNIIDRLTESPHGFFLTDFRFDFAAKPKNLDFQNISEHKQMVFT